MQMHQRQVRKSGNVSILPTDGFKKENFTVLPEKIPGSLRIAVVCECKLTFVVFSGSEFIVSRDCLIRALATEDFRNGA